MRAQKFHQRTFSLAFLASLACGVPADAEIMLSIDALKRTYLDCERRALVQRIPADEIMQCSVVYEDLKRRAFDDNWIKLWQWSRQALGPSQDA